MATGHSKTPYSRLDDTYETAPPGTDEASSAVELGVLHSEENSNSEENKTKTNNVVARALLSPRRPFPWQAASALVSIVLLTVAAVGVLLASNGSLISHWKVRNVAIQPQVWLSVLATLTDGLTMFALAKAAETTYWRAAARGTTLRNMYDLYESQSFVGALNNLVHLRGDKLAVVTVLCLVSALRGPLFQRASVVASSSTRRTEGLQSVGVAQLVPPNFLYQNGSTNTLYDEVYDAYIERAPIRVNVDEEQCGDVCHGKVKGYGFDIKCSELTTIPWDSSPNSTVIHRFQDPFNSIGGAVPSFNSSAYLPGAEGYVGDGEGLSDFTAAEQRGWFDVVNLFKTKPVCGDVLSISNCSLHHAVVEYEILLRNGTVSLSRENWQDDNVLFQTPPWFLDPLVPDSDSWGPASQWAGWYQGLFNQEISMYPDGDGGIFSGVDTRVLLAKRFVNGTMNNLNCTTTFGDPTQFVLNRLREMAFRTAVAAAAITDLDVLFGSPALAQQSRPLTQNWTQQIAVTGEKSVVAYSVSIPYLVCAIVCSLLAAVAIGVLLYWDSRSGTKSLAPAVSFNPLDVARIFDAPLLQVASEEDMEGYVRREQGGRRVRYGVEGADDDGDIVRARMVFDDER